MKMSESDKLHVKEQLDCDKLIQQIDMGPGRKPMTRIMLGCITSGKTCFVEKVLATEQSGEPEKRDEN